MNGSGPDENSEYEEVQLGGSFVVPIHQLSSQEAFFAGFGQLRRFLLAAMDRLEETGVEYLELWQIRDMLTSLDLSTRDATDDETRRLGGNPND